MARVERGTFVHVGKTLIETPFVSRILRQRWDRRQKILGANSGIRSVSATDDTIDERNN